MKAAHRVRCSSVRPPWYLALACIGLAWRPPQEEGEPPSPPPQEQVVPEATSGPDAERSQVAPLELTLEAALDLARANNLDIERAGLETETARYDLLGSWGAFEWVFDGRVSYTEGEFEPQIIFEGAVESVESTTTNWHVDLTKPLTTGGRFLFSVDSNSQDSTSGVQTFPESTTNIVTLAYVQPFRRGAWEKYATSTQREFEILYRVQTERARGQRHAVLLAVHNAYWDLVAQIQLRDVATSALSLGRELLQQNQRRLDAGVGTEVEVLQAQAEVATRIETLLLRNTTVHQAMDDLKKILFPHKGESVDSSWDADIVPTTPLPEAVTPAVMPGWHQVLVTALEERADLTQLRLEIDRAKLRHARALSERLAGVDLTLSAAGRGLEPTMDDAAGEAASYEFPTYSAMLSYNMPIGNKLADNAARSTRTQIRIALVALEVGETEAMAEVRRALREVEYQAEAVRASEKSLELARRQLEAEQARYAADLSTNFQVLEFQQSLIDAAANWRRTRVGHAKALAALQHAQGRIDEDEQH